MVDKRKGTLNTRRAVRATLAGDWAHVRFTVRGYHHALARILRDSKPGRVHLAPVAEYLFISFIISYYKFFNEITMLLITQSHLSSY